MPVAAKLPSKQMNNSFLRSAKLDVGRRVSEQTQPRPPKSISTANRKPNNIFQRQSEFDCFPECLRCHVYVYTKETAYRIIREHLLLLRKTRERSMYRLGSSFSSLTNTELNEILYVSKRQRNVVVFKFLTIRTNMVEKGACQVTTTFKSLSAQP